jgi:hypothetical protein
MKNMKRNIRRFNAKKYEKKTYEISKHIFKSNTFGTEEELENKRQRFTKTHTSNRAKCSCSMCGNPRKIFKTLTMQEKKSLDSANDAYNEELIAS